MTNGRKNTLKNGFRSEVFFIRFKYFIWVRNYFFPKNYVTSEGAVSHSVLYYQQLSSAQRYQLFWAITNRVQCHFVCKKKELKDVNPVYELPWVSCTGSLTRLPLTRHTASFIGWSITMPPLFLSQQCSSRTSAPRRTMQKFRRKKITEDSKFQHLHSFCLLVVRCYLSAVRMNALLTRA